MLQRIITAAFLATSLMAGPVLAQAETDEKDYLKSDGSWIKISGRAAETGKESFMLDYNGGKIFVEMDDQDWHYDNTEILDGDHVTVYGKVDNDTYETTTIEARKVYAEEIETYVYAAPEDEEERDLKLDVRTNETETASPGDIAITGTITEVDGNNFVLDVGKRAMAVDTGELPYNPMDAVGVQQLEEGSLVTVSGRPAGGSLDSRRLIAENIIVMRGPVPPEPEAE